MPLVDLLRKFLKNCGTPSMASVRTAIEPMNSMNIKLFPSRYVIKPPTTPKTSMKSR